MAELARSGDRAGRIRVTRTATGPLRARVDPDAFAILIRNLLENAVKHSPAGTPVEVVVEADGVRIVNEAPPLAAGELQRLRRRFAHGGSSASGSGLGLAIADAVARSIGADLELLSPATGREAVFETVARLRR